jgi:hypothetical protein
MVMQLESVRPFTFLPNGAAYLKTLFRFWEFLRELRNHDRKTWIKLIRYLLEKYANSATVNTAAQALYEEYSRDRAARRLKEGIELVLPPRKTTGMQVKGNHWEKHYQNYH